MTETVGNVSDEIEIFTLFALVRCLLALVQLKLDSRSTK